MKTTVEINLANLEGNDGVKFARSLSPAAQVQYGAKLAHVCREGQSKVEAKARLLVNLAQGCQSKEAFDELMTLSESAMKAAEGDEKTGGKAVRRLDRTWIQYKSNLRRAFTLKVLPCEEVLAETDIRVRTKAAGELAKKTERAKIAKALNEGGIVGISAEDLAKQAKTLNAEFVEKVNALPHVYQVTFWESCRPILEKVQEDYKKAANVLNGVESKAKKGKKPPKPVTASANEGSVLPGAVQEANAA